MKEEGMNNMSYHRRGLGTSWSSIITKFKVKAFVLATNDEKMSLASDGEIKVEDERSKKSKQKKEKPKINKFHYLPPCIAPVGFLLSFNILKIDLGKN